MIATKAEQKQTEHEAVTAINEELKKQVESLQSNLEASKLSRLDTDLFLKEASLAHEKGIMVRKSFYNIVG